MCSIAAYISIIKWQFWTKGCDSWVYKTFIWINLYILVSMMLHSKHGNIFPILFNILCFISDLQEVVFSMYSGFLHQ